jgi:hypothetical protein
LQTLTYELKLLPFKSMSFSAACKVVPRSKTSGLAPNVVFPPTSIVDTLSTVG